MYINEPVSYTHLDVYKRQEWRIDNTMDYVIFDLEWNQCPYGKEKENPKLPFEIIEIGAVKMDCLLYTSR